MKNQDIGSGARLSAAINAQTLEQSQVFRQVKVQSKRGELHNLQPRSGFFSSLTVAVERVLPKVIFDQT